MINFFNSSTGKTLSEAYIEFATIAEAQRAVDARNMKPLKGRLVSCIQSCQEDLMRAVFPQWKGEFSGCDAVITNELLQSTHFVSRIPLIMREEINSLLVVCRNYKVFYKIFKSRALFLSGMINLLIYSLCSFYLSKASFLS